MPAEWYKQKLRWVIYNCIKAKPASIVNLAGFFNVTKNIQEVRGFGLTKPENLDAIDAKDVLDSEKSMIFEAILLDSAEGASRTFLAASRRGLRNDDFVGKSTILQTKKFRKR